MKKRILVLIFASLVVLSLPLSSTLAGAFTLGGRHASDVFPAPKTAALARAACEGPVSKIDALVKAGADVNGRGEKNITPLIWAMTCHNYKGIEALLAHGANPNQPMEYGETPVWLAAGGSDPKLLPILLAHGGNPNILADSASETALMNAIVNDRDENVRLLIAHGADVNYHEGPTDTAAYATLTHERYDYLVYLLKHGYTYDLQGLADMLFNVDRSSPDWPYNKYKTEAYRLLAEKGIKPHKWHLTVAPPPPGMKGPERPLTTKEFVRQQEEGEKLLQKKGLERPQGGR